MNTYRHFSVYLGIAISFIFLLGANSFVLSADEEVLRSVLDGLQKIYVSVAPVSPEFEEKGLTREKMQAMIEGQLKEAKIEIVSEEEFNRLTYRSNFPIARLDVFTTIGEVKDQGEEIIIYNIMIQVNQRVILARKPSLKIFSPTWEKSKTSYGSSLDAIIPTVNKLVDEFIENFISVNRKG